MDRETGWGSNPPSSAIDVISIRSETLEIATNEAFDVDAVYIWDGTGGSQVCKTFARRFDTFSSHKGSISP